MNDSDDAEGGQSKRASTRLDIELLLRKVEAARDEAISMGLEFEVFLLQAAVSALNERLSQTSEPRT